MSKKGNKGEMYSLIFEQIRTCCSRAAALVDRGDEGQDTIQWLPFEGLLLSQSMNSLRIEKAGQEEEK